MESGVDEAEAVTKDRSEEHSHGDDRRDVGNEVGDPVESAEPLGRVEEGRDNHGDQHHRHGREQEDDDGVADRQPEGRVGQPGQYEPRPLALQKLAAALVYEIPWLPRDSSTLRVQRIIYRSGFNAERFSYADLIRIWFEIDKGLDQTPKEAGTVRDPEAYLATRMKLATNYIRWFDPTPAREQR